MMPRSEHNTSRRAGALGTIWWLQKRGLLKSSTTGSATHDDNGNRLYSKLEVFADFGVPGRTGMRWLQAIPKNRRGDVKTNEAEESPSPQNNEPTEPTDLDN
ncbi:hypothetical protein MN608_09426 [Microdochium nivale]|nr:hypothetical protein MN608_09426 [Microdochium nivale]